MPPGAGPGAKASFEASEAIASDALIEGSWQADPTTTLSPNTSPQDQRVRFRRALILYTSWTETEHTRSASRLLTGHARFPNNRDMKRLITALMLAAFAIAPAWAQSPKPVKKSVVKALVKSATDCSAFFRSSCEGIKKLIALGPGAGPPLMDFLGKSKTPTQRAIAVTVLGEIGHVAAGPIAMEHLKDKHRATRHAAILAVAALKPDGYLNALSVVAGNEDRMDKIRAATALGRTRQPGALGVLTRLMKHHDPQLQAAAVGALALISDPSRFARLVALLADPRVSPLARIEAAKALGPMGDKRATPMLLFAAGARNVRVRVAAINSLGKMKDKNAIPALAVLARDPQLTYPVVTAFMKIKSIDALPALIRIARDESSPAKLVQHCFFALGALDDPTAVAAVVPFLEVDDPEVVGWAADALGAIGSDEANEALIKALDRDDQSIKEHAAGALQSINGTNVGTDASAWRKWMNPSVP